ncbi:DNA-directed RNA polymerase subunit D [Staphylothermus hellenicus]|uniref:DNA-directed RNA polymerase subunit Rpo3 n=1 Tax=Staphylothermus hellenicus (strain DSM 12710 / JCM 10830 / BK20S6-10-b1 / P8) TaxID=591019 RepID=D7DAE1_STAHD|nr:DNA-directed RNA polymerase subunit D [Staphylothermus hellenicus]ADI32737.1 RNA polymerase insert [Staphylothermus hellenicus DSM 12710]
MEINVLEKTPLRLKLYIKDIPLHVLNSIRRVVIAEVPTMAIDSVVFTMNSSVFYDEYIAHRLGLIPLTSEAALDKYKSPEECKEASDRGLFTEDCFVKLDLEGKGEEGKLVTLHSGDLKTSDPDVKPVYDNIPIIVLGKNQEIRLEAYARLGRGKEHAKWSPVSIAAHKYIADIHIDEKKCLGENCKKCVEVCPRNILSFKNGKITVNRDRIFDCSLCRICEEYCPAGAIKVGWRENEYILTIESTGSLPPKRILIEAVKILENKIDDFIENLRGEGIIK